MPAQGNERTRLLNLFFDLEAGDSDDELPEERLNSRMGEPEDEDVDNDFVVDEDQHNEQLVGSMPIADLLQRKYVDSRIPRRYESRPITGDVSDLDDDLEKIMIGFQHTLPGDWPLFEIKCVPGEEYELLMDLVQKSEVQELRSAFASCSHTGLVYVEVQSLAQSSKISLFLRLHPATLKRGGEPVFDIHWNRYLPSLRSIRRVPTHDLLRTLHWVAPPFKAPPEVGDWVQVKDGLYRGDVGLVYDEHVAIGGNVHSVGVLLIPRLRTYKNSSLAGGRKGKRKQKPERPAQALFSPASMRMLLGHSHVEQHATIEHQYKCRNQTFRHGLLQRTYNTTSVSWGDVHVPAEVGGIFRESGHPLARHATFGIPLWVFEPGEPVKLANVEAPLSTGTVQDVFPDRCVVRFTGPDARDEGEHLIEKRHLRKVVRTGDYIKVSCGEMEGLEAWVVGLPKDLDSPFIELLYRVEEVRGKHSESTSQTMVTHDHIGWETALSTPPANAQSVSVVRQVLADKEITDMKTVSIHVNCVTPIPIQWTSGKAPADATLSDPHYMPIKVPWREIIVLIIRGIYKGRRARVKDVNLSTSPSGLRICVQWEDHSPYISNTLVWIDYDNIVEATVFRRLADFRPPGPHSPFQLKASYKASPIPNSDHYRQAMPLFKASTPRGVPESEDSETEGGSTPLGDRNITGSEETLPPAWDPSSRDENDPSPSEPCIPYWLLDERLFGMEIEVFTSAFEDQKTRLVTPTDLGLRSRKSKRHPIVPIPLASVRPASKAFMVTHEAGLMVVVKGFHTGKYVRRVSYFFDKERVESKRIVIVAVVYKWANGEQLTGEILELLPECLAMTTPDSRVERSRADDMMRQLRDEYRKQYVIPPVRYDWTSNFEDYL